MQTRRNSVTERNEVSVTPVISNVYTDDTVTKLHTIIQELYENGTHKNTLLFANNQMLIVCTEQSVIYK